MKKSRTPEYHAWEAMIQRCYNPKHPRYNQYGGRKIKVCRRWKKSFDSFLLDLGPRPSNGHSIDRINNRLGYRPDNCRWATAAEQMRNTRKTRNIRFHGRVQCLKDWAKELNINYKTLHSRMKKLPPELAFAA